MYVYQENLDSVNRIKLKTFYTKNHLKSYLHRTHVEDQC